MRINKETKNIKRIIIIIVISVLAITLVGFIVVSANFNKKNKPATTSKYPTAQDNYTSGDNRENSSSNNISQGGATDNHGKTVDQTTPQDQWNTSASGLVTLKQPITSATVKSGDEFSGTVKGLDKIEYRLVDNNAGVISQGELKVVNDSFSGNLQFKAKSNSGFLDIYSFDGQGREVNSIKVSVVLK